ncbi:unnamed protein product [Diatraea saccharalis]|uniref:Uncharacterized protein n=1 Tax=Diatraea saccharalis TaxID=40085 RepID=A0A9N9R0N3_9NEOP|nr:unnamed protein product [Diatraea saccharalis]
MFMLSPNAIKKILQAYSTNINLSISLSKTDKGLLSAWSDEFQIKRVNITTRFRVQMMKHKDHSFRRSAFDKKWIKCLDIYSADIDASEHMYYENESDCLKTVNAEDADKRKGLKQLEREAYRKRWLQQHLAKVNNDEDRSNGRALFEIDHIHDLLGRVPQRKSVVLPGYGQSCNGFIK